MTYPNYDKGGTGMLPKKPTREPLGVFKAATIGWTGLMFALIAMGFINNDVPSSDAGMLGAAFGVGFLLFIWTGGMVALALLKFLFKK